MLHPTDNRINFGEALRPPQGYELDYALGTSYNLDLEAILFLPVALFFGSDWKIESKCSNELLTALTKVPDKVQLFCQKGKIAAPPFYHNILEFWGSNIEQIQLDDYNKSFHPKIWLIRYVNTNNRKLAARYRFICTSRNLTKSTDWDIAITLDGIVIKTSIEKNIPLLDFVKFLDGKAKKKIKQELLSEITNLQFELAEGQEDYAFFPIAKNWQSPFNTPEFKANELLVISPFLHSESIKYFTSRVKKLTVLSTTYELDKLPVDSSIPAVCYFQFNPILESDMASVSEENNLRDLSDSIVDDDPEYRNSNSLHAKLFVEITGSKVRWHIGSANCTNPALDGRNVEFITSISGNPKTLFRPDDLLKQLTFADKVHQGIFIPYEKKEQIVDEELEQLNNDTRKTIFDISQLHIEVKIVENADGLYDYEIEIPAAELFKRYGWCIYFQPLSGMRGKKEIIENTTSPQQFVFAAYELHRLTPYFLFSILENNSVVKTLVLKLDIDFPEDRMKKVFSSLVGNWEKLMKYLSFLLDKEHVANMVNLQGEEREESTAKVNPSWQPQFPLYEKLLVAASRDVPAIRQTIQLVEMLSQEEDVSGQPIVQTDFHNLIKIFKATIEDEHQAIG